MKIDWQKPITIMTPMNWASYVCDLNEQILVQYQVGIDRHFGMPVNYPCMVFSVVDKGQRFVEHRFIYAEEAIVFVKLHKEMNSRLARIILEN